MRDRLPDAWSDLLARDRIFSTQPYTQLAGVLLAAGHRNTADTILFAGRERERDDTWSHSETTFWHWLRRDFSNWVWLTFFGAVAGYGIGLYTFRVLWWVLALTVLGAAVLWYSPHARRRGIAWRCGASLHRLLPIVELHKDFKDFFDSTPSATGELRKLHRWQVVFFSVIALAGWVLGFFLLAAMGGLTPK